MTAELVLIGGGARSGKSAFALALAKRLGARRAFVATAESRDEEMDRRIARHRLERRDEFVTFEEPLALPARLSSLEGYDVAVVDCLTLWLSNLLCSGLDETEILRRVDELTEVAQARRLHTLIITNEVGMGIVPESALGRLFRDLAGIAHQRISAAADRVYAGMLGTMLRIKPGPVAAASADEVGAR
jgi:adenosylcobinamide kinase/adenosylcobinamide-phosphate guanylyltransferase